MKYYAEYNKYGSGTVTENNGVAQSAGTLFRFAKQSDRDVFVDGDVWDGNFHRNMISRDYARKMHRGAFNEDAQWTNMYVGEYLGEQFLGNN